MSLSKIHHRFGGIQYIAGSVLCGLMAIFFAWQAYRPFGYTEQPGDPNYLTLEVKVGFFVLTMLIAIGFGFAAIWLNSMRRDRRIHHGPQINRLVRSNCRD